MFTEAFPTTPVFMTFGNNDCLYHYEAAWVNNLEFYSYIYNLWFVNHIPNRPYQSQVKDTFLHGGYYSVDLTPNLTLISINSMNFNDKNQQEMLGTIPQDEMKFIES